MALPDWFRPPLRTLTGFIGLVGVLACALAWFGWQVISSDRELEHARSTERLDATVDRIGARILDQITILERLLPMSAKAEGPQGRVLTAGVVAIGASMTSFDLWPQDRLLFSPVLASAPLVDPLAPIFADGEAAEVRGGFDAAIRTYQKLAQSPRLEVQAAALARLARVQRKAGRARAAVLTYKELERLDRTPVFGVASALQASEGRLSVAQDLGATAQMRDEGLRLRAMLLSGRHSVDRATWDFLMGEARRSAGDTTMTSSEQQALALSRAADWMYQEWLSTHTPSGRRTIVFDGEAAFVVWRSDIDHIDAVLAGPDYIRAMWDQALSGYPVRGVLQGENDTVLAGASVSSDRPAAVRKTTVPGLQWTIVLATTDAGDTALFAGRRRMLISVFAVVGVVLVVGSFSIVRSIARQRAVARLQADFVSAVSHEFRTPLTALRQLSELLAMGRVPTEEQRQRSYELLANESERLQRLVESLLDFGRVQAGAFKYRFEAVDGVTLVSDVVSAFRETVATRGFDVTMRGTGTRALIRADRDALGLALRNLLDNAVKYSPDCRTIWIDTDTAAGRFAVRVRDRGIGIPAVEQQTIFGQFVRGAAGRQAGISGTGIGLTLARQIVVAHSGEIRVDSTPGSGSTFTITLPLEAA